MAGKKSGVQNADFLQMMRSNTQRATQEVSQTLKSVGMRNPIGGDKKTLEYRDVEEMIAAPEDWNRYPLLRENQPDRYLELKMSIYEKGIETPLILWERDNGLMILAGHNRKEICHEILQECKDEKDFDEKKYRFLPCIVYGEDEITEEQAREIIDDTNLYRDFSKLPNKVKIMITKERMELYKRRRYAKGERIDQLAKDLGLEKTAVYENLNIYEKIIQPLQDLYYNEKITRKGILKFLFFDEDTQKWIFETYGDKLTDAKVKALKKNMGRTEIAKIFEGEEKGIKRVTVDVPLSKVEEFRNLFEKWMKGEIQIIEVSSEPVQEE